MKLKISFLLLMGALCLLMSQTGFAQIQKKKSAVTRRNLISTKLTLAEIEDGKILLSKADCLGCHKLDSKLIGPAYIDVAKKYPPNEASYNYLAHKIVTGGSGVWGQVAMSAHPAISAVDAKKMAKYVLSVR